MVGRSTFFVLVTICSGYCASPAWAQDDDSPPRRATPLSKRFEQLRQDLLGDSAPPRRGVETDDTPSADRKITGQMRTMAVQPERKVAAPLERQQIVIPPPPSVIPAPPTSTEQVIPVQASSGVVVPSKLKSQGARRATSGSALTPTTVEPVDRVKKTTDDTPAPIKRAKTSKVTPADKTTEANSSEPTKEPRMARSLPLAPAPKRIVPVEDEPAEHPKSSSKAASGLLFTTQSPVLSVEASGPRKVMIGKEAQFVVTIRNSGSAANNVVVSINIPNYAEIVSAQATSGAAQAATAAERHEPLEWKINRLESKGKETLTLKIVPRKSTPLDLAVQWTFTPEASQTLVEVQEPKLAMAIAGPEEVLFGQSKVYKLTVSNPGNGDSENVTVGLLPIGRASEGIASHRLGTLKAGESKTIDVELTARQAGVLSIKAQAFADGGLRSEAAAQVMVRRANMQIDVEAPKVKYAGTVGTYHLKVTNAGNAVAENVQVAALLPPDAKYVSSSGGGRLDTQQGKVNWSVGTLQPGGECLFELQCSLSSPGENRTQFMAMADGDLSAATTSSTRVEALADLKLEVRDPQGPIAIGDDAVYEVHIRNRGTKAADGIDLTVFFSEGLEATTAEGGPHDIGAGQVVFKPLATLGAGDAVVYRVHARADRGGNHVFRAEVLCHSLHTKLAAEEATHFYGEDKASPLEPRAEGEPTPAKPLEERAPRESE